MYMMMVCCYRSREDESKKLVLLAVWGVHANTSQKEELLTERELLRMFTILILLIVVRSN